MIHLKVKKEDRAWFVALDMEGDEPSIAWIKEDTVTEEEEKEIEQEAKKKEPCLKPRHLPLVRWLGVEWLGKPWPLRVWARLRSGTPLDYWDGCGCIATLKVGKGALSHGIRTGKAATTAYYRQRRHLGTPTHTGGKKCRGCGEKKV